MEEVYDFVRDSMEEQRVMYEDEFNRHVSSLAEDYQARLEAAGERIQLVQEVCDRRYAEL